MFSLRKMWKKAVIYWSMTVTVRSCRVQFKTALILVSLQTKVPNKQHFVNKKRRKCTHKWMEAFEPTFQKASHSMAKNTTMSRSTSNPNPETHSYEIGVVWRQARLFADTLLFFPFRSQTSNSFNIGEIYVSLCVTFRYVLGMCMNVFYDWCCFGITNRVIVKCIAFLFTWFNVNRCLKSRTVHAEKTTRYFEIHSVKWYVYQNNNESLTIKTKQIQI